MPYQVTSSIKITWVPFRLLKTDMSQAPSAPNTSRWNISSSTIITMRRSLIFDTALPNKCGQMFWLNLYKVLNFDRCVHSSWIAPSIMLKSFNLYRWTTLCWILFTVLHQRAPFLILHRLRHSLPLFFQWNLESHRSHLHCRGMLRHPYHLLPVLNSIRNSTICYTEDEVEGCSVSTCYPTPSPTHSSAESLRLIILLISWIPMSIRLSE